MQLKSIEVAQEGNHKKSIFDHHTMTLMVSCAFMIILGTKLSRYISFKLATRRAAFNEHYFLFKFCSPNQSQIAKQTAKAVVQY